MTQFSDGPASPHFTPLVLEGMSSVQDLPHSGISPAMAAAATSAPSGQCVGWGIPFVIERFWVAHRGDIQLALPSVQARWLVFMHCTDSLPLQRNTSGFYSPMPGAGHIGEHAATYTFQYADGTSVSVDLRHRHHIGRYTLDFGEAPVEAAAAHKPFPIRLLGEQQTRTEWGKSQQRIGEYYGATWNSWLWAWENPFPERALVGWRCSAHEIPIVISAITAGSNVITTSPLRWESRQKAVVKLPSGAHFAADLDADGLLRDIQLDLGQIISATPRPLYPHDWEDSPNNAPPNSSASEVLVEFAAHPQAQFVLTDGNRIPIAALNGDDSAALIRTVAPAHQRVRLRVVEAGSTQPTAAKLHVHGAWGEYLAPTDRQRIINPAWFEDYGADFIHQHRHPCTYIAGETTLDLPLGPIFIEVAKGFEVRPVRRIVEVTEQTRDITIELERVLDWRAQNWVTADTHVHFLSPSTALLEGAAEGVNVINLLASQWGELLTNVGDFDGRTTWGSREAGGDGEYLVRVGSENRQNMLGHISLLGYEGAIIAPMTTGGPAESAIGDPVETLLLEWGRQCKAQGGLVVAPHFPYPRLEHAAALIVGAVDAVEMTSWEHLDRGIDPYSLSDWYRFLNCGYLIPAVAGTDKMMALTAVGAIRTYAHIAPAEPFTYANWMEAVRRGETFVTYGPLLEFAVEGQTMGRVLDLPAGGGHVTVSWRVASVTVPVTQVQLVVNGTIAESIMIEAEEAHGTWNVHLPASGWLALLIRGRAVTGPEIIAAHSSPILVRVADTPPLAAADALTLLAQIEGSLAYLEVLGTRAAVQAYQRMRLELLAAYRSLHHRLHQQGLYHEHGSSEGTKPEDLHASW